MSVRPDRYNFTAWKGATFRKALVFHEGDRNSAPRNLTGYTARMTIKDQATGLVAKTLTTENGGIVLGGSTGIIMIFISDGDTTIATWQLGNYSLFLSQPNGDTDPLLYGNFSVKEL